MNCKNCGSSNVTETIVEGYTVKECQVCGHLHGSQEVLQKIEEIKKAKETGIDPIIYPLHSLFQKISNLKIEYSCPGFPKEKIAPYISFIIADPRLKSLEQIAEAVIQANKKTTVKWMLEVTFQKQLLYILKPNFHHDPYHISVEQISISQKDIEILAREIEEKFQS
ncbi:MAG: hypothetical protein HUU50_09230 [Candidatus Brocadiae bacterium]|nr:hypothetical protein [Candidatus Brocadiia bacterium]